MALFFLSARHPGVNRLITRDTGHAMGVDTGSGDGHPPVVAVPSCNFVSVG